MKLLPDFVTGNTRLTARLPDLAASVGDGTTGDRGGWATLLRAVPPAYTGQAREVVEVLTARHDLSDVLALLRGAVADAPIPDRLAAVSCVGRVSVTAALDVTGAGDGTAAVARLVAWRLPDAQVSRLLPGLWERFELHQDTDELETGVATAAHRSWGSLLESGGRRTEPVRDLLAVERDRANVVALVRDPSAVQDRLLPPGQLDSPALAALAMGNWAPVLRRRPEWRPAVQRWETHFDLGLLEADLTDLVTVRALALIRHPDPFGVEVAVGYVLAVEGTARRARLAALPEVR